MAWKAVGGSQRRNHAQSGAGWGQCLCHAWEANVSDGPMAFVSCLVQHLKVANGWILRPTQFCHSKMPLLSQDRNTCSYFSMSLGVKTLESCWIFKSILSFISDWVYSPSTSLLTPQWSVTVSPCHTCEWLAGSPGPGVSRVGCMR